MNRNEKWVQRMKKAVTLLLVVSLVLGSVPANVLAAGSARLNAAIAAADEDTQETTAPSDTQETLPTPDTTEPEAPSEEESSQAEQPAEAPEAQAAEEALKAAEAPQDKEAEPLPKGPEIMAVENPLKVVEAPETQDAEIGERVVLSANIEAQDPAGVTYQWQAKNGGDAGTEVQSTDEALEQKKASLEAAESIDLTGITGDESLEAAEAVQSKARGIAEAKTRPIEPDNEGWSDIPGANSTQLAVDVAPETAGAPTSYRMVARTSEAAIATTAAMIRTNADFESGSGTERDPYIIATDAQFENLHKYEGEASKGVYWRIRVKERPGGNENTNRWICTGNVPIGKLGSPFMGTLDGDGYNAIDYTMGEPGVLYPPQRPQKAVPIPGYDKNNQPITLYGYGLFGYVKDATIINLNTSVSGSSVERSTPIPLVEGTSDSVLVTSKIAVAGENTTIENCATDMNLLYAENTSQPGEKVYDSQTGKTTYTVRRYAMAGGLVGCGTIGDGYSVRFTGTIHNCFFTVPIFCRGSNGDPSDPSFTREGTIYPNTSLEAQYRPTLKNVYSRVGDDVTPGSAAIDIYKREENEKLVVMLNDYVARYDSIKRLNYWSDIPGGVVINDSTKIKTRGLLDFKVSDYITTYDGSPQKAVINCAPQA